MNKIIVGLLLFSFSLSFGVEKYNCIYKANSKTDVSKRYPFNVSGKIIWGKLEIRRKW